jgi:hypothetical protein
MDRHATPQPGLRLTASDRPGVAQPVPERDIPDRPWRAISVAVLALTLALTGLWEWKMRDIGLVPGDQDSGSAAWAFQRRRIDREPVQVAIVGDSRILFDTNLDRFQQMTGVRPVQLALEGTNGRPFLEDLANDPKFKGLAIVGMRDPGFFRKNLGLWKDALDHGRWESPATRLGFLIHREVRRWLAMPDPQYSLSKLLVRMDHGLRKGVDSPYDDVWKLAQTGDDRQTWMWAPVETNPYLQAHAKSAWLGPNGKPIAPDVIAMTQSRSAAAVKKIRARGGDVIFIHPPEAKILRDRDLARLSRAKGWDALLAATDAKGIHADDMPEAQGLRIPEDSHLSRACAVVFTDAYVRRLAQLTPLIRLRPDAPPALTPADCLKLPPGAAL